MKIDFNKDSESYNLYMDKIIVVLKMLFNGTEI